MTEKKTGKRGKQWEKEGSRGKKREAVILADKNALVNNDLPLPPLYRKYILSGLRSKKNGIKSAKKNLCKGGKNQDRGRIYNPACRRNEIP